MSIATTDRNQPNELELAILKRLRIGEVAIDTNKLQVIDREITGAGSYTTFALSDVPTDASRSHVDLNALIELPGVPNGLGAVLWLRGGVPECLEIYTFGEDDSWDGTFDGYTIGSSRT